jgi:hypothetical protein
MDLKTKGSDLFADVVSNAKEFVEKQKGKWDHTKWEGFLSDVQKKGVTLTDDMTNALGSVLESLKKLYPKSPIPRLDEVISNAKEFVEMQKGKWDHTKWESFLSDVQKKGVSLTDDISNTIGSILESLKKFYTVLPGSLKGEEMPKEEKEMQPVEEAKAPEITQHEVPEVEVLKEKPTEKAQTKEAIVEVETKGETQKAVETAQEEKAPEKAQTKEAIVEVETKGETQKAVETAQEEKAPEKAEMAAAAADEEQKTESKSKKRGTAKKSTRGRSKKSAESDTPEGEQDEE